MAATTGFVQGTALEGKGRDATVTLEDVASGNFLLLVLSTTGAHDYADTPDGWRRASHQTWNAAHFDLRQQLFIQTNSAGGDNDVTLKWPGECQFIVTMAEFSGVYAASLNPADVHAQDKGLSKTASVTGGTTNAADELWIGAATARNNDTFGAASGWTKITDLGTPGASSSTKVSQAVYYQLASATGPLSLSAPIQTQSGSRPWLVKTVSYPSSASGAPGNIDIFSEMVPMFSLSANMSGGTQIEPPNAVSIHRVQQATGGGLLWMGGGNGNLRSALYYSTNGTSWTAYSYNSSIQGEIAAIAGDKTNLWVWEHRHNSQRLLRIANGTSAFQVMARGAKLRYPLGMVIKAKSLYVWTGAELRKYDATGKPIRHHHNTNTGLLVHNTGFNPADGAHGGITATDTSVVYFVSQEGQSTLYEYKELLTQTATGTQLIGAPDVLWEMPLGFTAKAMCYQQGSTLILGDYNGKLALFALSPSLQTLFLGFIRPQSALTARCLAPGQGNTVLIGCYDGSTTYAFVYDIGADSFSLLGSLTISGNGTIDDLTTYLLKRVGTLASASTVKSVSWNDDYTSDGTTTAVVTTGSWDYNTPEQTKVLIGFNILHSTGNGTLTFSVDYDANESGSFTSGAVQTPAAGARSTFVQVTSSASTVKFKQLRLRINSKLDVYSVSALAHLPGYYETWDLVLRLKDESDQTRASGNARAADDQRDNIITAMKAENIVAFIDGYSHKRPERAPAAFSVRVEDVQDVIARAGAQSAEGVMKVKLRNVVPST